MDNTLTLNHLIYQVLSFESSGSLPNEMKLTWEFAKELVEEQRAILISQALVKKDEWNDSWLQYFCADLEQIDSSQCPCQVPIGCYIQRTKLQIPSTIDYYRDNSINSVLTPGGLSITKSNPVKIRYNKYNKYTSNSRMWFIKDNYMYIINDNLLDTISISGLFERPMDISRFTCGGIPCMTEDSPYPVSLNLASQIVDIIIKTKLTPFLQFPSDNSNNANSDTPKQTEEQKQAGI